MINTGPKYPDVHVQLTGQDGNAFMLLGLVGKALSKAGVSPTEFLDEATAGDYNHLLRTCMEWVDVE